MGFEKTDFIVWNIGSINAGTNKQLPVFIATETLKVKKVYILDDAGVSAHSTNYTTLSLVKGETTIASKSTKNEGIAANTGYELTLSSNPSDLKLDAGDVLEFSKSDSGTGAALTSAVLVIEFLRGYP